MFCDNDNKAAHIDQTSARHIPDQPETCDEMVNKYGTYNIQPTAETQNEFPAIAQGLSVEQQIELARDRDEWKQNQEKKERQ